MVRHAVAAAAEAELRLLPALLDRRGTAIDVGAHAGWYAGRMAQLARHVRVFEPNPVLAAQLVLALPRRCAVEPVALSDREADRATLVVPLDPDGEHGTNLAHLEGTQSLADGTRCISLPTRLRRLDGYRDSLRQVTLIKIDVEGHERAVISGGRELIGRDRPTLIVEIEHRHDPQFPATFALLDQLGYTAFAIRDGRVARADASLIAAQDAAGYAARMAGGPAESYINNLIFLHRSRLAQLWPRLRAFAQRASRRH